MENDENMEKLQELIEKFQICVQQNQEHKVDIHSELKRLLHDLQNRNIANDVQYNVNDSPGYQLITNRFGRVSNNTLAQIATQLSSQSQIPISRNIYRKPILLVKWIDCHIQQFANLIETMELPSSQ